MDIYYDFRKVPRATGPGRVVALGFFDGVHLGHQSLLGLAAGKEACSGGGALTFWPHPLNLLRPGEAPPLLMSLESKERAMAGLGLQFLAVQPFTRDFAELSPERFFREVLLDGLGAQTIVVGFNFSFGAGGAGTAAWLVEEAQRSGVQVLVMPPVTIEGELVSSSAIREHIRAGRVEQAATLLGRRFAVRGVVQRGDGRGHTIGFPTANVVYPAGIVVPAAGVYVVEATVRGRLLRGVANIGRRPTFYGRTAQAPTSLEVYLFDFSGDLYGVEMEVHFGHFLRPERAFPSVEELVGQIRNDTAAAAKWFSKPS